MAFEDRLLRQAGIIYLATNYNVSADTLPNPSNSNMDSSISTIESTYTFHRLAQFQNLNYTHAREDEQTTQFDDCDLGSSITARLTPSLNFDMFGVNDFTLMKLIFPTFLQSVVGTPVTGATQLFPINSGYSTFIKIGNQNGSGAAPTITSLVQNTVAYTLLSGTDYELVKSGADRGIILINSGNYDNSLRTLTLTYNYTPSASDIIGYTSVATETPRVLFKFVSCTDQYIDNLGVTKSKINTVYTTKMFLNSEYTEPFTNLANGELQSAALTFTGDKTANYYHKKSIT